jgi:hypothetical protein
MSLSFAVQASIAYVLLVKRIGRFENSGLIGYGMQVIGAGVFAGVATASMVWALGGIAEGAYPIASGLGALVTCVVAGAVGVVVYLGLLLLAKNPEVRSGVSALKGILRR